MAVAELLPGGSAAVDFVQGHLVVAHPVDQGQRCETILDVLTHLYYLAELGLEQGLVAQLACHPQITQPVQLLEDHTE